MIKTKSFELSVYAKGDIDAKKLAILTPGRLDSKDYVSLTSLVDELADQGYYALSFDPPGTWGSGDDIRDYTTTNTLKAIDELIDYFHNRPTVLIGHSRGGANSMLAGIKNPYVTHMVAIMSPAGPSGEAPKDDQPTHSERDLPPGNQRTKDKKIYELPASYFKIELQYNAKVGLQTCKKPKLFFYGTKDDIVKPEIVKNIYEFSAEPKLIKAIESEHDYRLHPEAIKEVNDTIKQFLVDTA